MCQTIIRSATRTLTALALLVFPIHVAASGVGESLSRYDAFQIPAELLNEIAAEVPEDADADTELLLSITKVSIDALNRVKTVRRRVYVLRSQDSVDRLNQVAALYSPWRDAKPEIHARVYADGEFHYLDAESVSDTAIELAPAMEFADTRIVRAPLPGLGVGAVVEEVVVTREHTPLFSDGITLTFPVALNTRGSRAEILIETADELPAKSALLGRIDGLTVSGLKPDGSFEHVTIERNQRIRNSQIPTEPEIFRTPSAVISTGRSWSEIARSYGEMVQSAANELDKDTARKLLGSLAGTRAEKIQRALNFINQNVRYTSLDLRQTRLQPDSPQDVVARKFGDCKDQAVLLIALLHAQNIIARGAVLSTDLAVSPDHPGMGAFNHMIVYLPEDQLWIDPTDPQASMHRLPHVDQNRYALVLAPRSEQLRRTHRATPGENVLRRVIEISYRDNGFADYVETMAYTGTFLDYQRGSSSELDQTFRTAYGYRADHLQGVLHEVEILRTDNELAVTASINRVKKYGSKLIGYSGTTDATAVFDLVPLQLTSDRRSIQTEFDAHQPDWEIDFGSELDFYITRPHTNTVTEIHTAPNGFFWSRIPQEVAFGCDNLRFERKVSVEDRTLAITNTMQISGTIEAREIDKCREILDLAKGAAVELFANTTPALSYAAEGNDLGALAEFRKSMQLDPDNPFHVLRFAEFLQKLSLNVPARTLLGRLVQDFPENAHVHGAFAKALAKADYPDTEAGRGSNLVLALDHYRKAFQLAPEDPTTSLALAMHLFRYYFDGLGDKDLLNEMIDALRTYQELNGPRPTAILVHALLDAGRAPEVLKLVHRSEMSDPDLKYAVIAAEALANGAMSAREQAQSLEYPGTALLAGAAMRLGALREYDLARRLVESSSNPELQAAAAYIKLGANHRMCMDRLSPLSREVAELRLSNGYSGRRYAPPSLLEPLRELVDWVSIDEFLDQERIRLNSRGTRFSSDRDLCSDRYAEEREGVWARVRIQRSGKDDLFYYFMAAEEQTYLLAIGPSAAFFSKMIDHVLAAGDLTAARRWARWAMDQLVQDAPNLHQFDLPSRELSVSEVRFLSAMFCASGMAIYEGDVENRTLHLADLEHVPEFIDSTNYGEVLATYQTLLAPDAATREQIALENVQAPGASRRDWYRLFQQYFRDGDAEAYARAIEQFSERFPQDANIESSVDNLLMLKGEYSSLVTRLKERVTQGRASLGEVSEQAWNLFERGAETEQAMELMRVLRADEGSDPYASRTYAALLAANGHLARASSMLAYLYKRHNNTLKPLERIPLAVIAKKAGYPDYARAIFQSVWNEYRPPSMHTIQAVWGF